MQQSSQLPRSKDHILLFYVNLNLIFLFLTILFPFASETNLFSPVWVYFPRKMQLE